MCVRVLCVRDVWGVLVEGGREEKGLVCVRGAGPPRPPPEISGRIAAALRW